MCCDAGYETKDAKMNEQINAWGKKLTDLVHTNLLGPNPKHGIFLDSCLHHCGGWGSYKIDGMVQGPAFQKCAPALTYLLWPGPESPLHGGVWGSRR